MPSVVARRPDVTSNADVALEGHHATEFARCGLVRSATAIFGPVASASLSDIAPPSKRGAWLSTYSTAQGPGQAVGPVLAGYLIAAGRFNLAFLAAGVIGLGAPLIVAGWQESSTANPSRARWQEFKAGIGEVARSRMVLVTSGAQAAQFVLNGALNAFLPLYGRDVVGLTTPQLGWLFGMQTVTTLAIRPLIGFLSDRSGRRWVIVAGLTVCRAAGITGFELAQFRSTILPMSVPFLSSATRIVGRRQPNLRAARLVDAAQSRHDALDVGLKRSDGQCAEHRLDLARQPPTRPDAADIVTGHSPCGRILEEGISRGDPRRASVGHLKRRVSAVSSRRANGHATPA